MKKLIASFAVSGLIFAGTALPVFAKANTHASCVGLDVSVEGPAGNVGAEVHVFLDIAKDLGVPLGSLVMGEATTHAPNCTP